MLVKRLTVAILCLLTLVGLITLGASFLRQIACEGQPINNNVDPTQEQQIWGERIISQSFVAPRPGLHRIDLFLQTYRRQNTRDVHLRLLEVTEGLDNPLHGAERFSTTFNAATVSDQSWRSFTFPPLANSAGKTYLISLQSPTSTNGDAITVGGIERNSYLPGTAYSGPVPVPADIAFRSCYQMTTFEKLQVLSEQITHDRPALWGNSAFYGLNLFIYIVLSIGFFWKLIARSVYRSWLDQF